MSLLGQRIETDGLSVNARFAIRHVALRYIRLGALCDCFPSPLSIFILSSRLCFFFSFSLSLFFPQRVSHGRTFAFTSFPLSSSSSSEVMREARKSISAFTQSRKYFLKRTPQKIIVFPAFFVLHPLFQKWQRIALDQSLSFRSQDFPFKTKNKKLETITFSYPSSNFSFMFPR